MKTTYYILTIGSLYGLYDFVIRMSAGKINPAWGAFLCQITSALLVFTFIFYQDTMTKPPVLKTSKQGILITVTAGFLIGLALITLMYFFQKKKTAASTTLPAILTLRNLVVILLGIIILKEKITFIKLIGLALLTSGLYLIL